MILRDSSPWTGGDTATLGTRVFYCQNWRHDVSVLLSDAGKMLEWVKYSSYGIPFALACGDSDADGDWDATDSGRITGWTTGYDVRWDCNLDGVIDSSDATWANSITGGYQALGRGILSSSAIANRKGYCGYESLELAGNPWLARNRVDLPELGRWMRRDPLGYVDGVDLYAYISNMPMRGTDPSGQVEMSTCECILIDILTGKRDSYRFWFPGPWTPARKICCHFACDAVALCLENGGRLCWLAGESTFAGCMTIFEHGPNILPSLPPIAMTEVP